ncbi:MAG TPA: glycosyltransferase, partial [Candidatus Bathyarchaeia archaeon]|nr:glycosyltransferase [Candidatus Bathyarchaeia archaeon]
LAERTNPGAGIEGLARLAKDARTPSQVTALSLRNLVVLLMKHNNMAKAEQVLDGALDLFPDYAELCYVGGLLCVHQNKAAKAHKFLERARASNHQYVGSGGESSYRANWLLGRLAGQAGNQRAAVEHLHPGIVARPVFGPAAEDLLKMRLPNALVELMQFDLTRLARREPKYRGAVFDFLLLHRAFFAARRMTETIPLSEQEKELLLGKLASAQAPFDHRQRSKGKRGILVCGSFFEHSSLARINREIAAALLRAPELDVALEPVGQPTLPDHKVPNGKALAEALSRHPKHLDLTIRHHWPPNFQPPERGKLAVILPWEFGAVPSIWVREIESNVDGLWVPSDFVRKVFVRAGVSEQRVRVIPNGVDAKLFTPEGPSARPTGCRRFMFLFVGGAIGRKGIDLLLQAYARAFEAGDDVTLAISTGANPAYAHNSLDAQLAKFMSDARLPHLAFLSKQFDDADLAAMYRGCDVFVLPYRGEGFGMPVAEAMACGKPVIVTAAGPALEFCPSDCGYFVPAVESPVSDPPPPFGEFVGGWNWYEPDVAALAQTMRHVYEHPEEAAARGRNGAKAIRRKHTWEKVTATYIERIRHLANTDAMKESEASEHMEEEGACRESLCP